MRLTKRLMRAETTLRVLSWLAQLYIRLVHATSRWTIVGEEVPAALVGEGKAVIVAFWHGRLLMLPMMWARRASLHMLISGHSDGKMIAGTIAYFGIGTIAGSTTEGGSAALRMMVRRIRGGESIGITPDGPFGPAMHASPGIVAAARLTRAPIVPMTYATSRRRLLDTWDRFHFPLPFSRAVFLWGEPITVPATLDDAGTEHWRGVIEERMIALAAEADRRVGQEAASPGTLTQREWRARRHAAGGR